MPRVRRQPCETKTRSNSLSFLRIGRSSQRGNQVRRGAEDRFQRPANEPRNGSSCPTVRENGHRRSLRGLRVSFDRQKDDGDQREKLSLSREKSFHRRSPTATMSLNRDAWWIASP